MAKHEWLKRRVFKDEMEQFTIKFHAIELLSKKLEAQSAELEKSNELIQSTIEAHKRDVEQMQKMIELEKVYCYLIPRLINSSGIEIPEDFDITNFDHAKKLYDRYRTGDLMNY